MKTVDSWSLVILQHNETGEFCVVLTMPDGSRLFRECASEADAEALVKATSEKIRAAYPESEYLVEEETSRPAPTRPAYMN